MKIENQKNLNFDQMALTDWRNYVLDGHPINGAGREGMIPLHYAFHKRDGVLAKVLIELGADVNLTNFFDEGMSLHALALEGDPEMLKLSLDSGARVNTVNHSGRTPLHIACARENLDTVNVLLEYGADVNIQDVNKQTPLYFTRNKVMTDLLIKHGSDIHTLDLNQNTPLHMAVYVDKVKVLLDEGAAFDCVNLKNQTPLDVILESLSCEPHQHLQIKNLFFETQVLREKIKMTQNIPAGSINQKKFRL